MERKSSKGREIYFLPSLTNYRSGKHREFVRLCDGYLDGRLSLMDFFAKQSKAQSPLKGLHVFMHVQYVFRKNAGSKVKNISIA